MRPNHFCRRHFCLPKYNMNGHDIMAFKEFNFMHITVPYDCYSKDITPEKICLINKKLFMILWVFKSA
jgi:hypothetical protein